MAAQAKAKTTNKKVAKKTVAPKRTVTKKSFKKVNREPAFFEMKFTEQSVYWIIFGAVAILFTIWLYTLDSKIRDLYDQVDANAYSLQSTQNVKPKKS